MGDQSIPADSDAVISSSEILWVTRLFTHVRKPENMLAYLVFTAWMKFMGIASHIPSITVG